MPCRVIRGLIALSPRRLARRDSGPHRMRSSQGTLARLKSPRTRLAIQFGSAPAGSRDMRRVLVAVSLVLPSILLAVSCSSLLALTSSTTLNQFVQALRQQGLSVSLAGEISLR